MPPQVLIVTYDSKWPAAFAASSREVAAALGVSLIAIHHIGSTSIPGMAAKPVIDMLAVVSDLAAVDLRASDMEARGYQPMGEFGIEGRRYFRRSDAKGRRTDQVHAFQTGSAHITRHLAFRDFMRTHPVEARQYAHLKLRLAAAHPDDIEAYMDGKDAFIKQMEERALAWAAGQSSASSDDGWHT